MDIVTSKAFSIGNEMLKNGITPNIVSYNTLLKGLCREDALKLWDLMLRRGLGPNEVSYCTLLDRLFNMRDYSKALTLWKDILARG
ncbi:hypothetical protein M5689_007905 [Euphorbia peplus]|nr:hypothetical protein M5689_007905 [Euphorbia peplus]